MPGLLPPRTKGQGFTLGPNGVLALPVAGSKTYGPYFTFQAVHLGERPAGGYKNYLDPFGQVYAYLSAWKGTNQYSPYNAGFGVAVAGAGITDCPTLGVSPYFSLSGNSIQYYNPSSYQIISAGTNKLFYPGGLWTPQNSQTIGANGQDDMTNFYPSLMGVPQ